MHNKMCSLKQMNTFCLGCTAICAVFLHLAKSNAFVFFSVPGLLQAVYR